MTVSGAMRGGLGGKGLLVRAWKDLPLDSCHRKCRELSELTIRFRHLSPMAES